ncbi:MAG: DegV family protein [Collinsella sp.]|nr:DegV family protein [Collinsella sp.]
MSKYVIVAESGSDLAPELAERYGIQIVPMHVTIGDQTYDDGSICGHEVYARSKELGVMPKTSAATVGDFATVFDRVHAERPDATILHLAYSAVTTCSHASALTAAEGRDYVVSIDTRSVSIGQSHVLVRTAAFLEEHPDASIEEISTFVEGVCSRVLLGFVPSDLAYLRAGGRLSNAQFLGAHLLKIKPVIEIIEGRFVATKKIRGSMRRAAVHFIDHLMSQGPVNMDRVGLAHSDGLPESIKRAVEDHVVKLGFRGFDWIEVGGMISSHCGPCAFGAVMERAE